ncbi:hypothetical protein [Sandaracinus amylolyticus]|uniref:hypothetical protein n=1 Tax=Sandaracinus amylolyticus TaxID=927083 RepID=UPI001F25250C|nr:hypothetical protein [Sandaracinus amylolyticus]UJR86729.1 Hypothetical protein I5071_88300 [Sandaracinus amylolyticus]
MRAKSWGVLVLAIALSVAACGRRGVVTGEVTAGGEVVVFTPAPTVMMLSGVTDGAAVRTAVASALSARSWTLESDDGTQVVARLQHRRTTLRVVVQYATSQVSIQYLDSAGLEIESPSVSRRYEGYMRQLTEQIEGELARPAREAQEAIARAQEEQLRREREAREAEERERDRQMQERLERERLATARAQAEADAERARAAQAQARVEGGVHVVVGRLSFDPRQASGVMGAVALQPGFGPDPYAVPGQAGGPVRADQLGLPSACPGWFQGAPQHTIVLRSDMPYLRFEAPSNGDATLAIVAPDGNVWCDDDGAGNLVPRIEGWFPAGVYQVYVGNYRGGEIATYSLTMSQRSASSVVVTPPPPRPGVVVVTPPPPRPGVVVVAPAPDCRTTLLELGHSSTSLMFCDGAEPQCADALLRAGHSPTSLQFCQGVEPRCAVTMMRSGRSPTELMHCQ